MEAEKEDKQNYLREQIIQQKYDPEDFAEYCEVLCGSVDIDKWTMRDLEDIVRGYVHSKKTSQTSVWQTSFAIHQQEPERNSPNRDENHKFSPPVKQSYRQPVKGYTAPSFNIESFNYVTTANTQRLDQRQKVELEEVFKDPFNNTFKKTKTTPAPDWTGSGWGNQEKKSVGNQEFNFDFNTVKQEKKSVTPPLQVGSNFFEPSHQKLVYQKQTKGVIQNSTGNVSIFDINFDDIKDLTSSSKKHNDKSNVPTSNKLRTAQSYSSHTARSNQQMSEVKDPNQSVVTPAMIPLDLDLGGSNMLNSTLSKAPPGKKIKQEGPRIVQEDWVDRITCIRAKSRQILLKKELDVVISGHEIVSRNLFMPDYVRYLVSTPALNSEVKRKYTHFLKLKNNMEKFYPGFRMPYLAKAGWIQETDPNNIASQKALIGCFINDLVMNRELKNCRIVDQFLTFKDYKALKVNFEEYDKMARLKSIEELCLLPGEVEVGYSEAHRVYLDRLPQFIHGLEMTLERYKKLVEQLVHNYQTIQKTLAELHETTASIEALTKGFNASVQIGECYQLESTLRLIRKMYKEIEKHSKFDMNLFQLEIKPLVRYQKDNVGTIREQLQMRAKFQEVFNPNAKTQKKEVYTNINLEQLKTRIDEPSRSAIVLKYQHGYFSNQAVLEMQKMLGNLARKLGKRFGNYCFQAEHRSHEAAVFWENMKTQMAVPTMVFAA